MPVYARDGGLPARFAKAVVRVEVTDENDNAPVFGKPWYSLEVPENQEAVELCFLKATDPDSGPSGTLLYRIRGMGHRLCVCVSVWVCVWGRLSACTSVCVNE